MAEPAQVRQRGGEDVGVGGFGFGQHRSSAATPPRHRPGRSRWLGCIAVIGCVLLLGCGGGEATTAPTTDAVTVPLCSAINSGEVPVPEDGNCRQTPTCAEVDEGAELPADGMCLKDE